MPARYCRYRAEPFDMLRHITLDGRVLLPLPAIMDLRPQLAVVEFAYLNHEVVAQRRQICRRRIGSRLRDGTGTGNHRCDAWLLRYPGQGDLGWRSFKRQLGHKISELLGKPYASLVVDTRESLANID